MSFVKSYDELGPSRRHPICIHLRSKGMFVTGEIKNLDDPDEAGASSQHVWCNLTQNVQGPDRGDCHGYRCIPGRECYRDSYDF